MKIKPTKKLSAKALEYINSANADIEKLSLLAKQYNEYNEREEESTHLKTFVLPESENQQFRYAKVMSDLESKKSTIESDIRSLSLFQIIEKKKLYNELSKIEEEIKIAYNNFCRMRTSFSDAVAKIVSNKEFMQAHPITDIIDEYDAIISKSLNPTITKLSKELSLKLPKFTPTEVKEIDKIEIESNFEDYAEWN